MLLLLASSGGVHEQSHGPAARRRRSGAQRSPARSEQPQSDDGLAGVEARDPGVHAGRVSRRTAGQRAVFHGIRSHSAVAVPARAAHGQVVPEFHLVDGRRLGVQAVRSGRGGAALGHPQEQTQNELRETIARPALLLRQEHHSQDGRQAIRLPFRVRSSEPSWVSQSALSPLIRVLYNGRFFLMRQVHCGGIARLRRSQTRQEGRRVKRLTVKFADRPSADDDAPTHQNQKTRSKKHIFQNKTKKRNRFQNCGAYGNDAPRFRIIMTMIDINPVTSLLFNYPSLTNER